MQRAVRAAVVLVVGFAVLVGLLWALQRRLVYLPGPGPVPAAADAVPGGQDVHLTTSDGLVLGAWFVPGPTAAAPTVLVAAGNGGSRDVRAPLARALSAAGLGVLLFDYRGYGGNPGSPSEEGLARDVRAARAFLVEEALTAATDGDLAPLGRLVEAVGRPFDERPELARYAGPAPQDFGAYTTFCGT